MINTRSNYESLVFIKRYPGSRLSEVAKWVFGDKRFIIRAKIAVSNLSAYGMITVSDGEFYITERGEKWLINTPKPLRKWKRKKTAA